MNSLDRLAESVIYRRVAPIVIVLCLVLAFAALVGTYVNERNVTTANQKRIADNEANAVTSCENANESREASRTLWNFVLDLSQAANTDATAQETAYLDEFRAWIGQVYQPRDCTDLSRKYPLPPPPAIPAN